MKIEISPGLAWALALAVAAAGVALLIGQLPEARRYMKMEAM